MAASSPNTPNTQRTPTQLLRDLLLLLPRLATSTPALRAYLTTFLLFLAGLILFLVSAALYALLYYTYISNPSFTLPIYLDYASGLSLHPLGVVALGGSAGTPAIGAAQDYDIALTLDVPRTRRNVELGVFMLDLRLLAPGLTTSSSETNITPYTPNATAALLTSHTRVLGQSRRPASLLYRSPLLELVHKGAFWPLYLVGLLREMETVEVSMMQGVSFSRGWRNVPRVVVVEVVANGPLGVGAGAYSGVANGGGNGMSPLRTAMKTANPVQQQVQIYNARATFTARLTGLRWIMYKHRIISFVVCTTVFWAIAMASCVSIWGAVSLWNLQRGRRQRKEGHRQRWLEDSGDEKGVVVKREEYGREGVRRIKQEDVDEEAEEEDDALDDLSDTSRSFPTFSRQPGLRYSHSAIAARIKQEELDEDVKLPLAPATAAEGDEEDEGEDEDEDADFVLEQRFERLADSAAGRGGGGGAGGERGEGRDFDSGIGSSMDSSAASRGLADLRKRVSRGTG